MSEIRTTIPVDANGLYRPINFATQDEQVSPLSYVQLIVLCRTLMMIDKEEW